MPNPRGLPLSEAVRFGWKTVQSSFAFILLTLVVAAIVPSIIEWGGEHVFHHDGQVFLIKVISCLVSATFGLGLSKIYLRFRDGEKPIFENLFDGVARAHIWFASTLIATVAILMGLVLLIVPGIIMMLRLWMVGFVLVDERTGPIDAIQRSWDITRGHTMDLLVFFIALLGLNILGAVCLLVGLFVTIPISGLAMAYVYRELKPKTVMVATPSPAPTGNAAPAV
ncbi:MAG TPA: hypothetical protein VN852_09535 [Candidatus Krumholzibacteria bacterium]|nr:hypothetical protein [Candidatus Krumholzibacteria bacterium]